MGGLVGSVVGGLIGSSGSKSAAKTQAAATDRATEAQREIFERQVELQAPFREAGLTANNRLMQMLGLATGGEDNGFLMRRFGMEDFEADPGYQFRMDEGMRGVEGGAAARGGLLSGAALKAIQKYGQGLASQEYGNAYNRFTADQTNQYNRLAGLVQSGQGAASQTANAAGQFGQAQANNLIGAGNAQASGIMGSTNALVGGINSGINNWQQNQMLDQMNERNKLLRLISNPNAGGWGGSSTAGMRPTAESYYGY